MALLSGGFCSSLLPLAILRQFCDLMTGWDFGGGRRKSDSCQLRSGGGGAEKSSGNGAAADTKAILSPPSSFLFQKWGCGFFSGRRHSTLRSFLNVFFSSSFLVCVLRETETGDSRVFSPPRYIMRARFSLYVCPRLTPHKRAFLG